MHYFHTLLPVQVHWADQVVLSGVDMPAKPVKAAAAAKPSAKSCACVMADLMIAVTA
jgi:hypothetical protein